MSTLNTALKQTVTMNSLPLGIVQVSGSNAKTFLQGQLTCDLNEVSQEKSCLAAHCTPKGRIISAFRLLQYTDSYLLIMPQAIIPVAIKNLQKYGVFSKVSIEDISTNWQLIGVAGENAAQILKAYHLPTTSNAATVSDNHIIFLLPGNIPRYLILSPNKLVFEQTATITADYWHYLDILAGIPTIVPETIELFTPHEINYPALGGVSFTKGCYTGQEIVARMEHLGKLKTKMVKVELSTDQTPKPGSPITLENATSTLGHIVNSIQVDKNTTAALVSGQEKLFQANHYQIADNIMSVSQSL